MTSAQPTAPGSGSPRPEADIGVQALAFLDGLYATAMRLTRNPVAADDLVQDTYLKAVRFAGRFERGTNLRAWLYTILHNTFLNERRAAGRDPVEVNSETVEMAADVRGVHETPEDLLLRGVLNADLKAALDALPDAFRQAVWLRDVEEFTYAEIAAMLGVPIGTVMSRLSRGRRLLHDGLSRDARRARGATPASGGERQARARSNDEGV